MIISINKDKNMTSRDVVNKLCNIFNTKKIGHTGTLDPIASGVLVCCIGHDTKLVNYLTSYEKEYIATMKLGILTDTLDITGNVLEEKDYNVDNKLVIDTLNSFLGSSIQEVPIYSAVKVNGKKLYEYARNNEDVELPKRNIYIKDIELLEYNEDIIKFRVVVSKGTYIRSLIRDIAYKMGTVGVMVDLIRTKQGDFSIDESYTIEDIINNNYKPTEYEFIFKDILKIELNNDEYNKVCNGCKMDSNNYVIYTHNNDYVALYNDGRVVFFFDKKDVDN